MIRRTPVLLAALIGAGLLCVGCINWSNQGRPPQAAVGGQGPDAGRQQVVVLDGETNPPDGVVPTDSTIGEQASGGVVHRTSGPGVVDGFGRFGGRAGADPTPRTVESARQHSFADVGADFDVDVDRKGEWLVFASTRHNLAGDLYLKRVDGVTVTQLTNDSANDVQPAFSPAGRQVAFASDRSGNWDIWLIDVDGRNRIRLTDGPAQEIAPAWSPDGRRLAYCSYTPRSGQWEIWVMDLANPASRTFVGFGLFPAWSPDGRADRLAFQRARQRGAHDFSVWTVDLVNGEPRYPTEVAPASNGRAAICPAWSPDGKRIVFVETPVPGQVSEQAGPTTRTRDLGICVIDADGTNRVRLTEAKGVNASPAWGPDGKVYFTSDRQGRESVFSLTVTGSTPAQQAVKDAALPNQPTAVVPAP